MLAASVLYFNQTKCEVFRCSVGQTGRNIDWEEVMKNFLKIVVVVLAVLFVVATVIMGCIYRDEVVDYVDGVRSKMGRMFGKKKSYWAD